MAVEVGVPGYADKLTPCSEEARGALICLNDEIRVALEEFDTAALDSDRALDSMLLSGAAALENQRLLEVETSCPMPQRWLPVNAIYQLTIRRVEDLDQALAGRLVQIPAHLRDAAKALATSASMIPPIWVTSTALAARRGANFVKGLTQHPRVAALPSRSMLEETVVQAAQSLVDFADFLERQVAPKARGDFACGKEYFEHLLRDRHFLDVGAERLHAFGERLFERTRAELEEVCQERFGHRDFVRAVHEIQSRHPSADRLLAVYTERVNAARQFVMNRRLVTIPDRECLEVGVTPEFLRHEIPFAAYVEPAPNDPEQIGRYYVTPPVNDEQLKEHDEIGLAHTCAHEAYPGHHLQFVSANCYPAARSLPRLLNTSATLYEGWALYCEQLMLEEGFLSQPESRMLLLRDRLWRALRVMLDIELHTRGLSLSGAADRMVKALGFPRSQAEADLAWYTRSPTVPFGYATGWALITALREYVMTEETGATLQSFHDRLLSVGSVALPLVVRRAFGETAWQAVQARVLGS